MGIVEPSDSNLVKREDCALVIIDIQEKLVPVISEVQKVIDNVIKLIKVAGIIGLPIVLTEQEKLGGTIDEIKSVLDEYNPITKVTFSCFGCEEFTAELNRLNRNTLLLAGIESHICVTQTALDALPGYLVHAVSDAISSRVHHNWETAISRMDRSGATITSTEMIIYELLNRAGTDEFREALPFLK